MRAVRALNRQRIMEIKAERLANGRIMATDCLGQLGHANEAAIAVAEGESIRMGKVLALDQHCSTARHACSPERVRARSPQTALELSARGPRLKWGSGDIGPRSPLTDVNRQHVILRETALRCRCRSSPALHAPSNIYSSCLGPQTEQTSL